MEASSSIWKNQGVVVSKIQLVDSGACPPPKFCSLEFPRNFKIEWIEIVLSRIYDMKFWLSNGLVEITKKMIHKITSYPTLEKKKTMRSLSQEEVKARASAKWNGWGLSITNISNLLIKFAVKVISHKLYQSS